MGTILKYRVVKGLLTALFSAGGKCHVPRFSAFGTEYPAAVVFALKNEDAITAYKHQINLGRAAAFTRNVGIEKKLSAAFF